MLDFLFLKPNNRKILYAETDEFQLAAIEPPFWSLLHSSYINSLGKYARIIDLETEAQEVLLHELKQKPEHIIISVSGHNPSASIMNMVGLDKLTQNIKDNHPHSKIYLHGLYPSSIPKLVLSKHPRLDGILRKEGFEDLNELMGIDLEYNINTIPSISWDLIDVNKYRAHNWHLFGNIKNRSPYGLAYSSFGCPYSCDFCCIHLLHPKTQQRNVDLVFQDIKNLYDKGVRNIKFMDELFLLNKSRVQRLCQLLVDSNMQDINAWAYARTDSIDEELIILMKDAGINWLGIGYESGSQLVLNSSDKRQNLRKAYKATEICKKVGMNICGNFVYGLLNDSLETMEATTKLSIDLQPEWANFNVIFAFPGTALYEKVKKEPWFKEPERYEQYAQHGYYCTPMGTLYLSPKEVLKYKDEAFRRFYRDQNYLQMIENKFGLETKEYIMDSLVYYPKRSILEDK